MAFLNTQLYYPPGLLVWTLHSTMEKALENHKGTLLQTNPAKRPTQFTATDNDVEIFLNY